MRLRRVLVLVLIALTVAACSSAAPPGGRSAAVHLRRVSYPGPFVPDAIQALGNRLWLIGAVGSACAIERLDPATLHAERFPLLACGIYVTAGAGHVYLVAVDYDRGAGTEALHLESVDAATGRAQMMAPVMVSMVIGSGLAHMALAYAGRWLWLYDWSHEAVLRISPASGAVTGKVAGVASGEDTRVMAADRSGLWVADGPGGQRLFHLGPGSTQATTVYTAPAPGSLLWVAALSSRVWVKVVSYSHHGAKITARLMAFDGAGRRVIKTGPDESGDSAVGGAGDQLWSVGTGGTCQGPQRVWRTDGATGVTTVVTTLQSPVAPCLTEGNQNLQTVGSYVFVLDATDATSPAGVLYRLLPS